MVLPLLLSSMLIGVAPNLSLHLKLILTPPQLLLGRRSRQTALTTRFISSSTKLKKGGLRRPTESEWAARKEALQTRYSKQTQWTADQPRKSKGTTTRATRTQEIIQSERTPKRKQRRQCQVLERTKAPAETESSSSKTQTKC